MPRNSTGRKLAASAAVLASVAAFVSFGAFSAFTDQVTNSSSVGAADIDLTNTPATALINLADLIPGDIVTRCVLVDNTGDIPADVAFSAVTGGSTALLGGLLVSVEEGTLATGQVADSSCTGYTAGGVYRLGTAAISTAGNYSGGAAANALTTTNYTGWPSTTKKYFQIKVAMPKNALDTLQNLDSTLQLVFAASSQAGSTTR